MYVAAVIVTYVIRARIDDSRLIPRHKFWLIGLYHDRIKMETKDLHDR